MKAARILSVAVSIALAVFGQDTAEPKPKPKRPALPSDLQSIHDLAMAAPPEFAADALLRLAASPKIADRKLKRELIEQALQLAPRAQNAYERVAVPGTATDTRSGFLAAALALRLDALSLQARAIAGLLALDKAAAVTALNSVPHPNIAPLKCDYPLVPDLSAYYAALGAAVEQALNNDPDERTRFLLSAISRMNSVAEVSPMARMLAQVKMANDEAQIVYGALLTQIRALPADPRSLTFYASHITTDLNDVMYRVSQLPGREELTEQVRTILSRHMEAQRCSRSRRCRYRRPALGPGARHRQSGCVLADGCCQADVRGVRPAALPSEWQHDHRRGTSHPGMGTATHGLPLETRNLEPARRSVGSRLLPPTRRRV